MDYLPLNKALKTGQLEEFIAQAEAEGVADANAAEFDSRLGALIKAPPPKGRTSRSRARGGSRGS
jgi:hypothetical protein